MDKKMNDNNTLFFQHSESGLFKAIDQIPINRGFLFGDGLFETMIYTHGKLRYKTAHLARLKKGCNILQIDFQEDLDDLENYLQKEFGAEASLRIRWNLFRSGMGKYTPENEGNDQVIMVQKHAYNSPLNKKAYISHKLRVPSLPWSNCKTLNALVYVMANLERKEKQFDEVILLNSDGYICEAGAANLFWIKNDIYYTPSLRSNCIAGIGRLKIIETLKDQDIELIQGEFKPKDFLSADQVFTSNVTGIHYISQIDLREFDTGPLPHLEKLFM